MTLLLTMFFVALNAFFVASEFAIVKIRVTQVKSWVAKGVPGSWFVNHAVQHLNMYLSATQLGITIASLGLGWIGEPAVAEVLKPFFQWAGVTSERVLHTSALTVAFVLISAAHIVIGEVAPKNVAVQMPDKVIFLIAPLMWVVYYVSFPIVWVLNAAANGFVRLLGVHSGSGGEGLTYSRDELQLILAASSKEGALREVEVKWLNRIFSFGHLLVREVMIPRTDMVCVNMDDSIDRIVDTAIEEGFSRLPAFKGSLDHIVGILYVKDLLNIWKDRDLIILQDTIRQPLFIPPTKKVSELLREFQKGKQHMAIVVDEYGGTAGLVTLEDLIEEIVGEIRDEYDIELRYIIKLPDGAFEVDGQADLGLVREQVEGWACPQDSGHVETLSGLVVSVCGRVPQKGEEIRVGNASIIVLESDRRRVRRVKMSLQTGGER